MNDVRVGLFFIDGLGIGEADDRWNPLAVGEDAFADLIGCPLTLNHIGTGRSSSNTVIMPTDAVLGVEGLPQSATGQTSLLTGINAQSVLGRHLNGFPTPSLCHLLKEDGIFRRLSLMGRRAVFANTFTSEYFHAVEERKWRYSATTVAAMAGNQPLKGLSDLEGGLAVYQDITRELLAERGYSIPLTTPEQAGRDLAKIIQQNDFTLYEYFQTDRCGHKQNMEWAKKILTQLSNFIHSLVSSLDPIRDLLIITSDHGNFEALDRKTHTTNPVPTIAWGCEAERFHSVKTLTDIVPIIIDGFIC